jgi:short-subunit dehydrogenase
VLVTGASSGIGRATAHRLAAGGDRVALASRSADVLGEVARECTARGAADVLVVVVDVADRDQVEAAFRAVVERWGGLDGVVHAAAVVAYGRFHDVPAEVFDAVMTTNVLGTANMARESLRLFEAQRSGSLVLLGSVLAKIAAPLISPYGSSKAAVHALARAIQVEARRMPGVEVSIVSPGGVDTPIYDQAASYTGRPGHPPPPVTTPERVAAACVRALDRPRRDVNVGAANAVMVTGFRVMAPVYDRMVGPLMSLLGQGRGSVEPGPGNVLGPRPAGESVRGRWPHLWG